MRAWMYRKVSHELKGVGSAGGAGRSALPLSPVLPPTQYSPDLPSALHADAGEDLQPLVGQEPDPTSRLEDTTPSTSNKTKQPPCHIDRLPTELLCRVFMLCGDPYPRFGFPGDVFMHIEDSYRTRVFHGQAIVTIGRVCSRWLTVSRGCPLLWTTVELGLPKSFDIVVLRLCLRYSASLPLTLRLHEHLTWHEGLDLSKPSYQAYFRRFLSIVAENAARWDELSIHVEDEDDILSALLKAPLGAYSSLKRTSVYNEAQECTSTLHALYHRFYASQELHSITFWDSMDPPYLTLHDAPITHLARISVRYMRDPQAVLTLLYSCPQLEVLDLNAEIPYPEREGVYSLGRQLCLPRLKILSLSGRLDWTVFLEHLHAPCLDRLDMRWDMSPAIVGMVNRSGARIRMLAIFRETFDHHKITVPLLQSKAMQSLQILRYDAGSAKPFNLTPFLPPSVRLVTYDYEQAESAYQNAVS
ncbi:hypothetical protein EV121DRAFT_282123 [Schizophyllum commune]